MNTQEIYKELSNMKKTDLLFLIENLMNDNQCFIRIDSVMEFDPYDNDTDTCRFFEPLQSEKNKNPFAEAIKSIKERKKGGEK